MKRNGFSLIELLIVMVIAGTLTAMGTFYFRGLSEKSRIEGQMKEMYADLMKSRAEALFQKKRRHVVITSANFSIYSSNNESVTPLMNKSLRHPVTADPADVKIDFDSRGVATFNGDITIADAAVCTQMKEKASVDSIAATRTQILLGKQNSSGCAYVNVTVQ